MSRDRRTEDDDWESDDWPGRVGLEKMARQDRAALPVSAHRRIARSSKETLGSKRVRKQISTKSGGIHRRRNRKID